ncbi:endonuclease Q family protein [Candidatus Woesearchaeota archaeon]|nr:endonuclease Q family protein [Candidatus Woesearchaeota archaeon]
MIIADLHIHGKYSQATSKDLTIPNLEKWAKVKGIDLLGTGDFTHPKWIEHIKEELTDDGSGVLKTKSGFPFILQTEISLIYSQDGKGRRIHNVVLAPNLEVVQQITDYLLTKGRIDYDGRPIFGIPAYEFVESLKNISNDIEIIPAHIWTPWFSLFGSKSGFDRIEDCYKDQTKHIYALETGLSSDPPMNWRLSQLDKYALVSFSDLHSFWPWRIGREATLFDLKQLTYKNLINAIRTKQGLHGTIEVDPNYGKYHVDGHRKCNVRLTPEQTKKLGGICPVCKRPLTIGVLYRVEELADRPEGYKPENPKLFHTLIPLSDIISKVLGKAVTTKTVWAEYTKLQKEFKDEMNILLNVPKQDLLKITDEKIADSILKNRQGEIKVEPGFDGEYGVPILDKSDKQEFQDIKEEYTNPQKSISDF